MQVNRQRKQIQNHRTFKLKNVEVAQAVYTNSEKAVFR